MTARSKVLIVGGLLLAAAGVAYMASGALEPKGVLVQTEPVERQRRARSRRSITSTSGPSRWVGSPRSWSPKGTR